MHCCSPLQGSAELQQQGRSWLGWGCESESQRALGLAEGHLSADPQRQIGRQYSSNLEHKGFIFAGEKEIAKGCSVGK